MLLPNDYSLTCAESLTSLARWANFNVDSVSWKDWEEFAIVAIMYVLEFPLNESLRKNVSFESRKGTWCRCLSLLRLFMTMPKVVRDLLMLLASLSRYPTHAVDFCLSEPARSIKCIFDDLRTTIPSFDVFAWRFRLKTACDLDDYLFICVYPMWRHLIPLFK